MRGVRRRSVHLREEPEASNTPSEESWCFAGLPPAPWTADQTAAKGKFPFQQPRLQKVPGEMCERSRKLPILWAGCQCLRMARQPCAFWPSLLAVFSVALVAAKKTPTRIDLVVRGSMSSRVCVRKTERSAWTSNTALENPSPLTATERAAAQTVYLSGHADNPIWVQSDKSARAKQNMLKSHGKVASFKYCSGHWWQHYWLGCESMVLPLTEL